MTEAGDIEKPRVLILFNYAGGVIKTSGSNFFGQYWIESTGGINVAADLNGTPEINMEQIYEWDPDIIYITNFSPYLPEDLYNNTIEGNDWSSVKAVKEGKVYKTTSPRSSIRPERRRENKCRSVIIWNKRGSRA